MTPAVRNIVLLPSPSPPVTVLRYDPTSDANLTLSGASVQQATDMTGNGRHASASGTAGPDRVTGASGINNVQTFDFVGANNDSLPITNALSPFNFVSQITVMAVLELPNFTLSNLLLNILSSASGNRFSAAVNQTTGKLQLSTKRVNSDTGITTISTLGLTAATRAFIAMTVNYHKGLFIFQVDDAIEILRPSTLWASGRGRTEKLNSSGAPVFGRVGASVLNGKVGGFRVDTGNVDQSAITAQRLIWQATFDTALQKLAFDEPLVGLNAVYQYV